MFDHCLNLAEKLPDAESAKFKAALADFFQPHVCWEKYLARPCSNASARDANAPLMEDDSDLEQAAAEDECQSRLGQLKAQFNKGTGLVLDFLLDLMSGKFLQDLKNLATANLTFPAAVAAAEAAKENDNDQEVCELVKQFRVVVGHFAGNSKSVGLAGAAPAPSLLATLQPGGDDAQLQVEREGNGS